MPKHLLFFGTRKDLESGLREYGAFARCHWYHSRSERAAEDLGPFETGEIFPRLGYSPTGQQATDPFAICIHSRARPAIREVKLRTGETLYLLEQDLNPDSIVVAPGGVSSSTALVAGRAATVSASPLASELMRMFQARVLRGFRRVGQYRVGHEAEALAGAGVRLVTMGVDEPPEYDLRLP